MRRNVPLAPGGPLARTSGLRPSPVRSGFTASRTAGAGPALGRKTAARDTGPSRKVRALVLERDGHACVCCGQSVIGRPYSLQHRQRRSQGGTNALSNLVVVLGTGTTGCHERIDSRRDPHGEARGYTVRSWQDPALVPVMIFSEGGSGIAAWLTDEGGYAFEAPGREVA
jgi:hypothetical protein